MPEYNPELVEAVQASIERARRLHNDVACQDGNTVTVETEELVAILESHFLVCGYVLGSEIGRKRGGCA